MPAPSFILFQGRMIGTAHIITVIPPRPEGGRQIIEARLVGGLSFVEEYEVSEEADGRYLALAALLIGDSAIANGATTRGAGTPFRTIA
jgi:hypothetical protein